MRRLKYQVMDWIDEHDAVRVPLMVICILAVCGLAGQCGEAKASGGGDPDGSGITTMSDCVYLINYIFAGGPEPVACGCPESFFLFDNQIPQAVETYYEDSNWIEAYIGGRTFVKGGPVRYVYAIGPDSQPSWFFMIPDTVEFVVDTGQIFMTYGAALMEEAWKAAVVDGLVQPLDTVPALKDEPGAFRVEYAPQCFRWVKAVPRKVGGK